jgi:hypothetical protein
LTAQHAPRDLVDERDDHGDEDDRPERVRGVGLTGEPQREADRQGEPDGDRDEKAAHAGIIGARDTASIRAHHRADA